MKRPLRILVDLDGIVCDTMPYWLDHIYDTVGVRAYLHDITQWALDKCPPLDKLNPKLIFSRLQDPGFMLKVPAMVGARLVLENLQNDGHEVYLVTARHGPQSMPETLTWVQQNLPTFQERHLIFCYDKHLIRADVIIDDKAETLFNYKAIHQNALCLGIKYAYNDHLSEDVAFLVEYGDKAWISLYQYILELAEKP